jgi:SAM-dependent methyltransferase
MDFVKRAEQRNLVVTEAAIDVLDVGSGDGSAARGLFPNGRVVRLDAHSVTGPDYVADICEELPIELNLSFDIVLASHVLEHISRKKVVGAVKNIRKALRYGGLAYLVVPSLEWAALEILKDKPSDGLLAFLYGEPDIPFQGHVSGYTLMMLRQLASMAGLHVREAFQTPFVMTLTGKDSVQKFTPTQNVVVAMRAEDDQEETNGHAS